MTATATPSRLGVPARFFLAAVVAVGLLIGGAVTASAASSPAAENVVGASTVTLAPVVGPTGDVSPGNSRETYDSQAVSASATGVAANTLPDDLILARGGANTADRFANGAGVTADSSGNLSGVSVNSGNSIDAAAQGIPHSQIGVTTVGDVRAAGGTVVPDATPYNPGHCLMSGCSADTFSRLFSPTVSNPAK